MKSPWNKKDIRATQIAHGKLINLRVRYPMGFFTKNVDGASTTRMPAGRPRIVDDVRLARRVP